MSEDLASLDTIATTEPTTQTEDSVPNLPQSTEPNIDHIYDGFDMRVRMAAWGEQNGVMIVSRPGIGKSHRVDQILNEMEDNDECPAHSHEFVSGTITPLALHETLYANSGGSNVLIFDDVEFSGRSNAVKITSALKGALEGQGESDERVVEWRSGSKRLSDQDIPQSFRFNASIIFLRNEWPGGSEHWEAVLSRCLNYEFEVGYEDRMELIREVARSDGWNTELDYRERKETAEWLVERTTPDMYQVDLRTLEQAFGFRDSKVVEWDSRTWKQIILEELGYNQLQVLAKESLAHSQNIFEAQILFTNTINRDDTPHELNDGETFFDQFDDPERIEVEYVKCMENVIIDSNDDGERAVDDEHYRAISSAGEATDHFLEVGDYSSNKTYYKRRDHDVGHMEV